MLLLKWFISKIMMARYKPFYLNLRIFVLMVVIIGFYI